MNPVDSSSAGRAPAGSDRGWALHLRIRRSMAAAVLGGCASLAACQGLPPAMTSALVGFGQDVLASAANNFTPQYAASMQNLLFALAETATGVPFTQQAVAGGYGQDDDYGYPADGGGEYSYAPGYEYVPEYEDEYAAEAGHQPWEDSGQGHVAHAPVEPAMYLPQPAPAASRQGVGMEVALLAQQPMPDGQVRLRPISDGEVLRDGRGDPARGDKIKLFFSANCACYVYVIGIDATGYVAQIFPEGDIRRSSRVAPGARYLLPEGSTWWGLDDHRGVEQIYFIASHQRRPDIEDLVAQLAGQRPRLPADYRRVSEPAVVAMTRGLVQVQSAAPTSIATEYGTTQQFTPTSFQATVQDADLVITRWFRHE
jgi:hypothetical protein